MKNAEKLGKKTEKSNQHTLFSSATDQTSTVTSVGEENKSSDSEDESWFICRLFKQVGHILGGLLEAGAEASSSSRVDSGPFMY